MKSQKRLFKHIVCLCWSLLQCKKDILLYERFFNLHNVHKLHQNCNYSIIKLLKEASLQERYNIFILQYGIVHYFSKCWRTAEGNFMSCVCYNSMLVHGRLQTRQLFQVIILRPIKKGDVQEKTWKVCLDVDRYIKLFKPFQ